MNVRRETLICDTSFVGHFLELARRPERYAHWDHDAVDRVKSSLLAISVVTVAEIRAGYVGAGWGSRRVAEAEREVAEFAPLMIDDPHLNEWARLWVAARSRGVALSDNDLWIAPRARRAGGISRGGRRRPAWRWGRRP
jgi:predicted nucleic acid-binding protein